MFPLSTVIALPVAVARDSSHVIMQWKVQLAWIMRPVAGSMEIRLSTVLWPINMASLYVVHDMMHDFHHAQHSMGKNAH
jgi:hypothetical protein